MIAEFALTKRADGAGSVVVVTDNWARDMKKLKNPKGHEKTLALMLRLAEVKLDKGYDQGWIKYPLHYTGGVAELRSKGVRSYGKPVGPIDNRTLVVFEAAEEKRREDEADQALTARAVEVGDAIGKRWEALRATEPADDKVVHISAHKRDKGKR